MDGLIAGFCGGPGGRARDPRLWLTQGALGLGPPQGRVQLSHRSLLRPDGVAPCCPGSSWRVWKAGSPCRHLKAHSPTPLHTGPPRAAQGWEGTRDGGKG